MPRVSGLRDGIARGQAQCTPSCSRYRSFLSPENMTGLTKPFCEPFPDGIPDDVWNGEFDHRQIHPEQRGTLVWDSKDGLDFPTYALVVSHDSA